MPDVNTVAEPSNATPPMQYDGWDEKGTPIVTKKPETKKSEETSASAESAKETQSEPKGKSAAESEAATSQEKKERKPGEKKSAEERIAELTSEIKRLSGELERSRSEKVTEPAKKTEEAKQSEPSTYPEWRKTFKPKEWIEQYAKDHPSESYEDATAAMADHLSDVKDKYRQIEQMQQRGRERSQEMLRKTVEKYPDAEAKVKQTAKTLMQTDVPQFVRAMIDDSDVMTDLLYTLSDQTTLDNLLDTARTNPGKAIRALRDMELEISKAVAKPAEKKEEKAEEKPAEQKPRAPKPPVEVGGRGTGQEDASVAAARSGDYRSFEAAENAKMRARFQK